MARYDVIIKNGTVFDGKGNPGQKTDIGIKGDKIKRIGDLQNDSSDTIIDASENYVAPGFIDLTTHSDTHWTLFLYPSQESLIRQGITTILGGNCGLSLAPLVKGKDIEGIDKWVDVSKINVNWQTIEEFFAEIEKHGLALNFCTMVGFNTLHSGVIGTEPITPTKDKIDQMSFLLNDSIEKGAFGLSTSFGSIYNYPLVDKEVIEVLKIVAKHDALSKHHLADEGKNILPSLSKLISFARESKVKLHISHLKALGKTSWGYFKGVLEMIKNARQEGINITCDFFPYTRTGSNLFMLLPFWIRRNSKKQILEVFRSHNSKERKDIIQYLKDMTLHYDRITIASALHNWENVGKTILEISHLSGLSNEEVVLNLLAANNLQVSIFSEVISEKNIDEVAVQEYSAIASDGTGYDIPNLKSQISNLKSDLPHPRSFGTFPRAFRLFVKEKKILNWEELIYKMTGLPTQILSLKDRGTIEKDNYADIVIFDPETITDNSNYDNPYQFSEGIKQVLINGKIILNENRLAEKSAGRLLKKK